MRKVVRYYPTMKITCHGCKKTVEALVLKRYTLDKPDKPVDWSDPIYPIFSKLKITHHKRGWFKPRCNRSGKTFTRRIGSTQSCQVV